MKINSGLFNNCLAEYEHIFDLKDDQKLCLTMKPLSAEEISNVAVMFNTAFEKIPMYLIANSVVGWKDVVLDNGMAISFSQENLRKLLKCFLGLQQQLLKHITEKNNLNDGTTQENFTETPPSESPLEVKTAG